jgi:hypothetical protein
MNASCISLVVFAAALFFVEPVNLLKPTNKEDSWRLEKAGDTKSEMVIEEESVVFRTSVVDSTDWHVQAIQTNLDLKDGKTYVIKFKAKSPEELAIMVNAMIDQDDWHQIGLNEEVQLKKEFKEYSFEFTASDTVAMKNRISFVLGSAKGTVFIKELTLTAK